MYVLSVSNLYIWKYHFSTPGIFKHDLFSCERKGENMRLADSENETAPVNTNFSDY